MNIHINGKQLKIGKSLLNFTKKNLRQINQKYPLRPVHANITFTKEKKGFKCEASIHLSSGMTAYCTGKAEQIYTSCEQTFLRLEKILRRYKRRIKTHHESRKSKFLSNSFILR